MCAARGCRKPASYDLQWNNPKIHTADRRKHWLACDDHRESLSQFLAARGFLKEVLPL
jgi:YD repeat-containing protein